MRAFNLRGNLISRRGEKSVFFFFFRSNVRNVVELFPLLWGGWIVRLDIRMHRAFDLWIHVAYTVMNF